MCALTYGESMIEDVVAPLRAEARNAGERRLLVIHGDPASTRSAAATAVQTVLDADETVSTVSPVALLAGESPERSQAGRFDQTHVEHLEPAHADRLLGRTRDVVVLDCHERCDPSAIGCVVGAVDGGGLLVLLAPPLDRWPDRRDAFDESLSVPPFDRADVTGHFRSRLVETLRAHPGIAIVDTEPDRVERDGLTRPAPRLDGDDPPVPDSHTFPSAAYDACLTADQVACLSALEALREAGNAVVIEADRGRGKSSAAGLAAGSLALDGQDVLVTAPQYRSAGELFARVEELAAAVGVPVEPDQESGPREISVGDGCVRFECPPDAITHADEPDAVIVDEAAALPVRLLEAFLAAPAVAFTTTVHGYEGAGRGFSVRFRDRLAESDVAVTERTMDEPIRYAAGDPIEVWAFRALLLDARPPVEQLIADATPATVEYARIDSTDLLADEHLLREVFGLLVVAHYRTEPADLARLLDAPNVTVRALTHNGHVVSVALLAREGGLSADRRAEMYEGARVAGNMIPDVLTSQLRDEAAGMPVGLRVMRIASHDAVRGRGLGSHLLTEIESEFREDVDWLGTGYGATPPLVDFWAQNGYRSVHLSTSRNERSGEHSAIMLKATTADGRDLLDRHTEWFRDRIEGTLADPLSDLDPDIVRAVLRTVDGTPDLDLSVFEWRVLAGSPHGAGLYDTVPEAFGKLALWYCSGSHDELGLTDRQERLLVTKALQHRSWSAVTDQLDFHSQRECMRTLGATVGVLVDATGNDVAQSERDRFG
ncbi:tRNA(Met) cytidine acetyltransferase [Halorhabdus sp. BNX81]|nr:tRNA(Met) cytidine acetyltransferase [Halorhabdus sp. BNX81]